MNQYIKNILETQGWKEIEKMFIAEIVLSSELSDIEDKLSDEIVAREARVRSEVSKRLKKLLTSIKLSGQSDDKKEKKYI